MSAIEYQRVGDTIVIQLSPRLAAAGLVDDVDPDDDEGSYTPGELRDEAMAFVVGAVEAMVENAFEGRGASFGDALVDWAEEGWTA